MIIPQQFVKFNVYRHRDGKKRGKILFTASHYGAATKWAEDNIDRFNDDLIVIIEERGREHNYALITH